jgi:hypothetical protein
MPYPARLVRALPLLFSLGADHESVADPVGAIGVELADGLAAEVVAELADGLAAEVVAELADGLAAEVVAELAEGLAAEVVAELAEGVAAELAEVVGLEAPG